jgi:membrane-anchored glycerophosphoryl diester phosphodiesterase (GDPDase)
MTFDMNRTWSATLALLSANGQLLAIIAGVFLLLPGTLFYVALPDIMTTLATQTNPDPDQVLAMLRAAAVPMIVMGLVMFVAQMIGYLAMIALMGDDRPTVGEALRRALAYLPTTIGVTLLLLLGYVLVALACALVLGLVIAGATAVGGTVLAGVLAFLGVIAMMVVIFYFATRFILTMPIIALDGITGPLAVCKRSWALTKSNALKIFFFYVLIFAAYIVIAMIFSSVFGVVAGLLGNGTGAALVLGLSNGLIGAAVAMLFSAIMVAMHRQLSGISATAIDQTFG